MVEAGKIGETGAQDSDGLFVVGSGSLKDDGHDR
jgi:hypothetical protein